MPANHYIDNEAKLITTTWEGEAVDSEFVEALKKYQKEVQNKPEHLDYNEIVNLTKMSRIKLSVRGLIKIGSIASSTDQYRTRTKLALVVNSDLAFNFAKLYATYRNYGKNNKKSLRIFKSESDALDWMRNKTQPQNRKK